MRNAERPPVGLRCKSQLKRMPAMAPERIAVLPRAEASGSHNSHGPFRESYTAVCKTTPCSAETAHAAAAKPAMPAERMRATLPPTAGARTLLQSGVPARSAEVVVLEGQAELSLHRRWQTEAERAKPALSRARQEPAKARGAATRSCSEGHHSRFFSSTTATDLAAIRASRTGGAHPANDSVRTPAGGPWNVFGSANAGGAGRRNSAYGSEQNVPSIIPTY